MSEIKVQTKKRMFFFCRENSSDRQTGGVTRLNKRVLLRDGKQKAVRRTALISSSLTISASGSSMPVYAKFQVLVA